MQKLVYELRKQGISAERDYLERSVKAQMKYANKIGAKYTVVLGDDEIERGAAAVKNMETGESEEISLDRVGDYLKNK